MTDTIEFAVEIISKSKAFRPLYKKPVKKILCILLAAVIIFAFCSCCGGMAGSSKAKKLTSYYNDEVVTSARLYIGRGDGGCDVYELSDEKLDQFLSVLDAMELKSHLFHTDYYWDGDYGIELSYKDGTFMTYDGTMLAHRKTSVQRGKYDPDGVIKSTFIEVTNCNFWEKIQPFFPDSYISDFARW